MNIVHDGAGGHADNLQNTGARLGANTPWCTEVGSSVGCWHQQLKNLVN
jgi:hypothetical protein